MTVPQSVALSAAKIALYTDSRAAVLEGAYGILGTGAAVETGTLAALEAESMLEILGDGSTMHPGLGDAAWQCLVSDGLRSASIGARYDSLFARQSSLMRVLDDLVQASLPSGWKFGNPRPFDAWLTRLNGAAGAPETPPSPGTLTPFQISSGALPITSSGSAPRILHTLVGSSDEQESLPTSEATQVALAGAQNSYSYQISGTVPAGIRKVRVYRSVFGGSGAPYGWDSDTAVTPGSAYPAIPIVQPDAVLRLDIQPPVWMQCPIRPAAAALYALAFASSSSGFGSGLYRLNASGMISPGNVALSPANMFLGVGNPVQGAVLGQSHLTGLLVSVITAGGLQIVNGSGQNLQGFAGAMGLRARVISALNGTLTPTISIIYNDAAHGWGSAQTTGGLTPTTAFTTGAVGDIAVYTLPTGAVVQSMTETSVAGAATSGSWVYEAIFPR